MKKRSEKKRACSIDGCEKPARYGNACVCEMHYIRMYRTGSYLKPPTTVAPIIDSGGYLRYAHQRVHRVAYEYHYGTEPAPCWGCGEILVWGETLHVDHINEDKLDNRPENLRPSCLKCNTGRSEPGVQRLLTAKGRTLNIKDWSRQPDVAVTHHTIGRRLKAGMSHHDAIFAPKITHKNTGAAI